MAINDGFDVTPPRTFSTTQFDSDNLNVVVLSLLIVLILANIRSVITKLMYFTNENVFNYNAWLRGFIYASSEDPMRIVSWISRSYSYRNKHWKRNPQKFRADRLVLPLLARIAVLIFSVASIAVTIPREKEMTGCAFGDYTIGIDSRLATNLQFSKSVCTDIPMRSARGAVRSTVSYCECPDEATIENFTHTGAAVRHNPEEGSIETIIFDREEVKIMKSLVEWKDPQNPLTTYRTNLPEVLSLRAHLDVLVKGLQALDRSCTLKGEPEEDDESPLAVASVNCRFRVEDGLEYALSYLRTSLVWRRVQQRQLRLELSGSGAEAITTYCPIRVTISRPTVNMVLLIIILVVSLIINVIVSSLLVKHGNGLDAGFHLAKEALGHDTTSNPLEQSLVDKEIEKVPKQLFVCEGGGHVGHVGFIRRAGDFPVEEFDDNITVGRCAQAHTDLTAHVATPQSYARPMDHLDGRSNNSREPSSLGMGPSPLGMGASSMGMGSPPLKH